jgi:hypothetical protein
LNAYKKVVSGASKMAKEVQSSLVDMSKAMTTELGKTSAKQVKAAKESFNSLPAYLRGVVSPATKAVTDGINKGITKQHAKFRKNLKQHTKDTLAENRKEVQRFVNLGAGTGNNAFRLTAFGMQVKKGVLASNKAARAAGFSLDDLVANAKARKKEIEKQRIAEQQEDARVLRRSRIRQRDRLRISVKEVKSVEQIAEQIRSRLRDRLGPMYDVDAMSVPNIAKAAQAIHARQMRRYNESSEGKKATEAHAKSLATANAKLAKSVEDGAKIQQDQMQSRVAYKNYIDDTISKMREFTAKLQKEEAEEAAARNKKSADIRHAGRMQQLKLDEADRKAMEAAAAKEKRIQEKLHAQRVRQFKRDKAKLFEGAGGNMMGARADIFMHTGALQNMTGMAANFLRPFAQVENSTIQMEAYAGSAEAAKQAVEELQRFAIESPYKLEGVLEASSHLMKYGQTAENAIEITKMLGDVAGGNTVKLELLALATAQATGFGKLQGQELRQLVNAGFNPLQTAAEQLAGGKGADPKAIKAEMAKLLKAMRAGQLSSDIIQAALEVETSEGGKFAGITEKQSKSLMGWANQFLETIDLIKIQITEAFSDELKAAMQTVVDYTQATVDWMKANKQLVKDYVMLGLQVLKVVVGFHLLGAALAYTKWIMGTVFMMSRAVTASFALLKLATDAMSLSANKNVSSWGNWLKGIGASAARIFKLGGILISLALLLEGLFSKDGFTGMFKRMGSLFANTMGFLYNIGHNITGIFDFIGKNWDVMLVGMLTSTLNIVNAMMMVFAKLVSFIPGAGDISNAMYSAIPGIQEQVTKMLLGDKTLDTSMFKFDGPGLGDLPGVEDAQKALEPFLPKDKENILKPAPDTDFNKFMGGMGGDGGVGRLRDHAVRGSAEHAMRMYEYGESAKPMLSAEKTHEKKTEDLLARIERNTRPGGSGMTQNRVEEAGLREVTA